ncbi:MAG: hypothetical protein WBC91_08790 [Phototrophicaceae bacterium]
MRAIGKFLWRFMVIFSFIVNFVLVAVLLVAGLYIFQIKAQVADPLIGGLHSTAAGLGDATIDWIIPVRDTVPVQLDVPINSNTIQSVVTSIAGQPVTQQIPGETVVTLTRPVPISITGANIDAGNLQLNNATVNITLPAGTQLPVALDLNLALNTELPIALDVRAVIPLSETQLNDPIQQLGLLFEPLAIGLHNLPNNFSEAGEFAGLLVGSDEPVGQWLTQNLLATDGTGFNSQAYDPWVGFSQTAGVGYESLLTQNFPVQARPIETGIVAPGGIPALDALLPDRAALYTDGSNPAQVNANSLLTFAQTGIPAYNYNGEFAGEYDAAQGGISQSVEDAVLPPINSQGVPTGNGGTGGAPTNPNSANTNNAGSGIIPTPTGN